MDARHILTDYETQSVSSTYTHIRARIIKRGAKRGRAVAQSCMSKHTHFPLAL